MWRSFSKGSKEHVKEQAKEQLKLKIGSPQLEDPFGQQFSTNTTEHDYPQPLPRLTPRTIQSPRSPYALQSPISPRNVNWDSNQANRPEALNSHPPTPGGSDKELPQIPQASPTPPIVEQNARSLFLARPSTSYYLEDSFSPCHGEFVNSARSENKPGSSYLINGVENLRANPHHTGKNFEELRSEIERSYSLTSFNRGFEVKLDPLHTAHRNLDLDYGKELAREGPSLPDKPSSNYSKSHPSSGVGMFNEGSPRKTKLWRWVTASLFLGITAIILAFTLAGSIYSFVKISQLESRHCLLSFSSAYTLPGPSGGVTHATDTMTVVQADTQNMSTISTRFFSMSKTSSKPTPSVTSTPSKTSSGHLTTTTKPTTVTKTESSNVHATSGPNKRAVDISIYPFSTSSATRDAESTETLAILSMPSYTQSTILCTVATSSGNRKFRTPEVMVWSIVISIGIFTTLVCASAVYQYSQYAHVLHDPAGAAKERFQQFLNETVSVVEKEIKELFEWKGVIDPMKDTVEKIKSKLHIDKRVHDDGMEMLEAITVMIIPNDEAELSKIKDGGYMPMKSMTLPRETSSLVELGRGGNLKRHDHATAAGRQFNPLFSWGFLRTRQDDHDHPSMDKGATEYPDGRDEWKRITDITTSPNPTATVTIKEETTTTSKPESTQDVVVRKLGGSFKGGSGSGLCHGYSQSAAKRQVSLPFQFPWGLRRSWRSTRDGPRVRADADGQDNDYEYTKAADSMDKSSTITTTSTSTTTHVVTVVKTLLEPTFMASGNAATPHNDLPWIRNLETDKQNVRRQGQHQTDSKAYNKIRALGNISTVSAITAFSSSRITGSSVTSTPRPWSVAEVAPQGILPTIFSVISTFCSSSSTFFAVAPSTKDPNSGPICTTGAFAQPGIPISTSTYVDLKPFSTNTSFSPAASGTRIPHISKSYVANCPWGLPPGYTAGISQIAVPAAAVTGELTFQTVNRGYGACAASDDEPNEIRDEQMAVAIYWDVFDAGKNRYPQDLSILCNRKIETWGPDTAGTVQRALSYVGDCCEACRSGDVDIVNNAFNRWAPTGMGRIPITWRWVPDDGARTSMV